MTFLKKSTEKKKTKTKSPFKFSVGGTPPTSTKSPFDYQIKTFEKEGEKDVKIPFINETAQLKVPEGFKERAEPTPSAPKTGDTTIEAAPSAKSILETAKVPTAADVLKKERIKSPEEILKETSFVSARDIIEKEEERKRLKGAGAQVQQSIETGLYKKEQDYLNNLDWKKLQVVGPSSLQTKFGTFATKDITPSPLGTYTVGSDATPYAQIFKTPQEALIFVPEKILYKGYKNPSSNNEYYNYAFLDKGHWEKLFEKAQYVDLDGITNPLAESLGNRGFLMRDKDYAELVPSNKWNFRKLDDSKFGGEITGLAFHPTRNELVYVRTPQSGAEVAYVHINDQKTGTTTRAEWMEQKQNWFSKAIGSIPLVGKPLVQAATDLAKEWAKVPFGPEIAAILAPKGTEAYVYASLSALRTAGQGGSLEDRIISAGKAYASVQIANQLNNYVGDFSKTLQSSGAITNPTLATAASGAVVYAGFSGTMAALSGTDIKKAMQDGAVTGAVGGAMSVNSKEITSTLLGGDANVTSIAQTLGFKEAQLQAVVTGSLQRATIAATRGEDFTTIFKNSLIENGITTAATNQIAGSLDKTLPKEKRDAVIKNTDLITRTIVRATVRGQDIDEALKRVTPQLVSTGVKGFKV